MDVAARCLAAQFIDEIREHVAVELVIAQHINDRFIGEVSANPLSAFATDVKIAGDYHDIRIRVRRLELREFGMDVTENVEAHATSLTQPLQSRKKFAGARASSRVLAHSNDRMSSRVRFFNTPCHIQARDAHLRKGPRCGEIGVCD